jgi:AmmeMemoRadiSam system protein B
MNARLREKSLPILLACLMLVAAVAIGLRTVRGPAAIPLAAADRKTVLESSIAGSWYSSDANELRTEIAAYLAKARAEPKQDVIALVLPHAGYAYSGPTAAYGIKSLGRSYKRVVVIGPTHRLPMEDILSVPRATHYETPLGQIPLDVEFIGTLLQYPLFQSVPAAHQQEHSVEIEIPLLQCRLADFKLVPIVAGQCSYEAVAQAGKILASLIDADTLVIASSDFTHYGPQYRYVPFKESIPENIKKLDMGAFEFIGKLDAKGLLNYRDEVRVTICGCVPIAVLLEMLGKDAKAELLRYTTSGEATGDCTNSVSYLAVAFHGTWTAVTAPPSQARPSPLTAEDKKQLLDLARRTIRHALDHQKVPEASDLNFTPTDSMRPPRGAFVTLKKNGQLRGCIGDIFPQRPLYKSVIGNAIYAAFGDRRFEQLTREEYDQIKIEISAWSCARTGVPRSSSRRWLRNRAGTWRRRSNTCP